MQRNHQRKKICCGYCLQWFSNEKILVTQIEISLTINSKPSIKLRNESFRFNYHPKQLAVSFKIYADFESVLKGVQRDNENTKNVCLELILINFHVLMIDSANRLFFTEQKIQSIASWQRF